MFSFSVDQAGQRYISGVFPFASHVDFYEELKSLLEELYEEGSGEKVEIDFIATITVTGVRGK